MTCLNYKGAYLEGLILTARKTMNIIKKYKTFNLSLLQDIQIESREVAIEQACDSLQTLDFNRFITARKHCSNTLRSKIDHMLAIDDILYNYEKNKTIGINWTTNFNSLNSKVEKHNKYQKAWSILVDAMCVVCILNEDVLENLDEANLAKAVYNILKLIDQEVSSKDFEGYLVIDAKNLK